MAVHQLAANAQAQAAPNDRITIAAIGVRGRGGAVLSTFAGMKDVDVKYIADVDEAVRNAHTASVERQTGKRPTAIKDFRAALDDAAVDAVMIGTPDHWHALPTIMACQAKKDVYVEKPDGHNIVEGQTMVAAQRKYERVVQLGTQARSAPHVQNAVKYLRDGKVGRVVWAKAWESGKQGSIGHVADSQPPAGVDYDMWLGPAPKRAFNARRFHGNWRWFFDYGTGDLGNDGVHRLDYARWGLAAAREAEGKSLPDMPRIISSLGGKHYFDDDQEWPDNQQATYDFGDCLLTYEMRVWTPNRYYDEAEGAAIIGDQGYVVIGNSRWRAFDGRGQMISEENGGDHTSAHVRNFLDCMRTREKTTADLATIGHPSSLLCHLGNASWRAGRSLKFDAEKYAFIGDDDAQQFLTRAEYRKPWLLPKIADL
jgi:predicted dehydrogenase